MALFQVNYKYVHANGKIRSASVAVEAKDVAEAKRLATEQIKKEQDHFSVTSATKFGS